MVAVPSSAHRDIALHCARHLRDGQVVVLNPGRTFGAIEFARTLRAGGCRADVVVAEAQTFLFASRSNGPAEVRIYRTKNAIPLAALPACRTPQALAAVTPAFPQFVPAPNVLTTSLDNMGAIFHPALTVLNAGRIEGTRGDFQFYVEGLTPAVARVLEAVDRERVTVAAALGIRAQSAQEWLDTAYNATGPTLYDAMQNNAGYHGIKAPATLAHRYIFEDVPMSLVPIASAGEQFGVRTPAIETVVRLASLIHGTDYRSKGRTMAKLGLANMTVDEIQEFVDSGGVDLAGEEVPQMVGVG
jgi:opine dehydrogenase